jgi:hypothetical protein
VDHEVDRQPARRGVPVADGVRARARPQLARARGEDLVRLEVRAVVGPGRRQLQLDVVVGERAGGEALQVLAADRDPDDARRGALDGLDGRSAQAAGRAV